MGILNFAFGKKNIESSIPDSKVITKLLLSEAQAKSSFKRYAIGICINRIANAICRCEFETYENGIYRKTPLWYQLNYEPNENQNASKFWNKVVDQMVYNDDGALIIQTLDGQLVVADSYVKQSFAVKKNTYSSVTVDGYMFSKMFFEDEVLHFQLNNSDIKNLIDSVYADYGTLLAGAIRNYNRSNAIKYLVKIATSFNQFHSTIIEEDDEGEITEGDQIIDELFENRFKALFDERDAAIPMEEGLELEDLNASGASKSSGSAANKTTRDIGAMFEDIMHMAADAFLIPRGMLKGDTADVEAMTDNFAGQAVTRFTDVFKSEINRKFYGREKILQNSRCEILTDRIINYNATKMASKTEVLARTGTHSVNDLKRLLGENRVDEPWADMHLISKQYDLVEELLKGDGMHA